IPAFEDDRGASRAVVPLTRRVLPLGIPGYRDPGLIAGDAVVQIIQAEGKATCDAPDILPLALDQWLAPLQHAGIGTKTDDVRREHRPAAIVVDRTHRLRELNQPLS